MTPKDQEWMGRYIYQVVRRLPREQRDEVGRELQELISDMLEETGSLEAVLTELGDPAAFANKYRDDARCLIGPDYYDTYRWFLKIVLICAAIPLLVVSVVEAVSSGITVTDSGVGTLYVSAVVTAVIRAAFVAAWRCLLSGIGAFGGVTLVFAILERQKVKIDLRNQTEWSVKDLGETLPGNGGVWTPASLQPVPHKKAIISRGEGIVGIVFLVIFSVVLIVAPQFFSAVFQEEGELVTIPLFNLEQWHVILPVLIASLLASLTDEVLRLIAGCYGRAVLISKVVTGVLQILLSVLLFKVFPFWNPQFAADLRVHMGAETFGIAQFATYWETGAVSDILLAVICLATLLDMGVTIYKTCRYGRPY